MWSAHCREKYFSGFRETGGESTALRLYIAYNTRRLALADREISERIRAGKGYAVSHAWAGISEKSGRMRQEKREYPSQHPQPQLGTICK